MKKQPAQASDHALGLDLDITRRDFLNSTLLASGGLLLNAASPAQLLAQSNSNSPAVDDWTGYGGIGDYANSNGNTLPVLEAGHRIRDAQFETLPADTIDTGESYDCVVVGGGISGLAAALIFQERTGKQKSCVVLDNHPIFGGEAKRNEFLVDGAFREYERQIRQLFANMFSRSGFDAKRDIAGIILNRWGHAYLTPPPGFFFGKNGKPGPGEVIRAAPFGRIAFANTDLSGVADHRSSIIEANRAVGQLLDQVVI